ncbi:hypothetical protein CEXT_781961 [Caerostris extrusa]|uniref:Uncharacterized protein n=1 Tax=Caerostris extrusa TaxID=172846 RepID=A0AAV4PWW0_CAEEX|nr:hypothetical protein CEXT_781961 [Caerostris extrusa]
MNVAVTVSCKSTLQHDEAQSPKPNNYRSASESMSYSTSNNKHTASNIMTGTRIHLGPSAFLPSTQEKLRFWNSGIDPGHYHSSLAIQRNKTKKPSVSPERTKAKQPLIHSFSPLRCLCWGKIIKRDICSMPRVTNCPSDQNHPDYVIAGLPDNGGTKELDKADIFLAFPPLFVSACCPIRAHKRLRLFSYLLSVL